MERWGSVGRAGAKKQSMERSADEKRPADRLTAQALIGCARVKAAKKPKRPIGRPRMTRTDASVRTGCSGELRRNDAVGGDHETHEARERNRLIAELDAALASTVPRSWWVLFLTSPASEPHVFGMSLADLLRRFVSELRAHGSEPERCANRSHNHGEFEKRPRFAD
jgi:hypothetical protein